MLVFPNSKINLGLQILNKREDGFHNIETVFYPIGLKDALEIIPSANTGTDVDFTIGGLPIEGMSNDNMCPKAYQLLKNDFPQLPAIKMHLQKAIPMGAGMGGGSADGAFTLMLLNEKFKLQLTTPQIIAYALQLGSDCPFFIINKPCYATGRGEILEEIKIDLSAYKIVVVNPNIQIHTRGAFNQLTLVPHKKTVKKIIGQPMSTWKDDLKNDFEETIFAKYPKLKNIKTALYSEGALYASMTGTGSTFFGIFETTIPLKRFTDKNYFVKILP
jgi:4-diphosphocytidyl-2-C-methyl-D-erythritol kinase